MNNIISKWIMGCTKNGPIAGKVIESITPQYPGQEVSHKVSWIEDYEGWLDEGHYIEFDQNKWNNILNEWNKIITSKQNIQNILGLFHEFRL